MNLEEYTVDDFLSDESFQNWVLKRASVEEEAYWEQWTRNHPEQRAAWEEAAGMLSLFQHEMDEASDADLARASWSEVRTRIRRGGRGNTRFLRPAYRYAAVLVGALCMLSMVLWYVSTKTDPSFVTYAAAGERMRVMLPDSSWVVLSANTTVKTADAWNGGPRTVWLEKGEAFFAVDKKIDKAPFKVVANNLEVLVTGTQFSVDMRQPVQQVVLKEGQVKLSGPGVEQVTMKPNEKAEYMPGKPFQLKATRVATFYNWETGKISFDNTPIQEINQFIEDYYHFTVTTEDQTLLTRKISGRFPNDSLDLLLRSLEIAMDVQIVKEENRIQIKR